MCIAFNTRYYVRQSEWALSSRLVDRLASGPPSHLTYIGLGQMSRDRVCNVTRSCLQCSWEYWTVLLRDRVCKCYAFVFADVFFQFKSEQVQSGTYLYEEIWRIKYYVDSPRQLEPTPTPREKKGTRVWVEYLCNSICVCVWGTMHLVLCTTYYVPVHSTMYYLPRTSYEVICTVASWYQRYYVRGTRYV